MEVGLRPFEKVCLKERKYEKTEKGGRGGSEVLEEAGWFGL